MYHHNKNLGRTCRSIGPIVSPKRMCSFSAKFATTAHKWFTGPITVRFYKDAALMQPIGGAVTIPDGLHAVAPDPGNCPAQPGLI